MTTTTLAQKIEQSTIDIALFTPFLVRAVHALTMVPCAGGGGGGTMATDGTQIIYDPIWAATLTRDEFSAVRVHEIMHALLGHHLRRGSRDSRRWNIACDYTANPLVAAAGYHLPADALLDPRYSHMSAEQIYDLLPPGAQAPAWGDVTDAPTEPGAAPGDTRSSADAIAGWRQLVQATSWGHLPSDLARTIEEQLHPAPTLCDLLAPLLAERVAEDYSWLRGRRVGNTILPRLDGRRGHVVICIDTSGSIDESMLREIWDVAAGAVGIATIDVVCADAAVQTTRTDCESLSDLLAARAGARGGGGTDFAPALAWADARQPHAIVYLTDLASSFPAQPPAAPVIWVQIGDNDNLPSPPFGLVIGGKNGTKKIGYQ